MVVYVLSPIWTSEPRAPHLSSQTAALCSHISHRHLDTADAESEPETRKPLFPSIPTTTIQRTGAYHVRPACLQDSQQRWLSLQIKILHTSRWSAPPVLLTVLLLCMATVCTARKTIRLRFHFPFEQGFGDLHFLFIFMWLTRPVILGGKKSSLRYLAEVPIVRIFFRSLTCLEARALEQEKPVWIYLGMPRAVGEARVM